MKRAFLILFGLVMTVVATSSLDLKMVSGQPRLQAAVALADCAAVGSTDGKADQKKCAQGASIAVDPYVCVALPPIGGLEACPNGGVKIPNDPARGGAIVEYLRRLLGVLSGAIAGVVILMIVIAGIQYILSAGDPARVKTAKTRLQNAILGLVLFLLMFAILSFIIPGGIL